MKLADSMFEHYELTLEEQVSSVNFSELNIAYLKNLLHDVAVEKATLGVEVDNPQGEVKFRLSHEYLRGQVEILTLILDAAESSKTSIVEELIKKRAEQQENN